MKPGAPTPMKAERDTGQRKKTFGTQIPMSLSSESATNSNPYLSKLTLRGIGEKTLARSGPSWHEESWKVLDERLHRED